MKKVFFISMLAVATIVACGKEDEEATPQVQEPETAEEQTVIEQITIMKSDETGIVIRIGEGEEARDSIIPLTVPYFAPSVLKGQVVVQVGEGDNIHDSIVYIYEPVRVHPAPQQTPYVCDTCK